MSFFVDLHCHLDLYPDFQAAVDDCERNNIYTIAVTTVPAAWPRNKELSFGKKFVRPALGLHPQLANDKNASLELWDKYFEEAKYIGEIGLDAGPRFYASLPRQESNFGHILQRCAQAGGKILSIHSVRTAKLVLDHIESTRVNRDNKIILHWYTGTANEIKRAAELGCFFSVNIQMLRSPRADSILKAIPLDRLLTETDGPFVIDEDKPINPGSVMSCINLMAELLGINEAHVKEMIYQNFSSLLMAE